MFHVPNLAEIILPLLYLVSYLVTTFFCICPGPVLRAQEGETLRVTFMNKADRNYSIQPHGLHYDKRFQGTNYEDGEEAARCTATDTVNK